SWRNHPPRCRRRVRARGAEMAINIPRVPVPAGGRLKTLWIIGAGLLVLLISYNSCTTYVRPGEAGVKQIKFGLNKGIEQAVYGTGLHYVGAGETMHRFPVRVQVLELSNSRAERSEDLEGHRVAPGVNIQTSEGYTVAVDVTVLYRIADPYKVMTGIGPGRLFEDSAVIPRAQQDLRRALGELDAEDFYRGNKRVEKAQAAQAALKEELQDKGIE